MPEECGAEWRALRDVVSEVEGRLSAAAGGVVRVRVGLQQSAGHMRIPLPEEGVFGREAQIKQLLAALAPEGARVLVHGCAGVGKDTLVGVRTSHNARRHQCPEAYLPVLARAHPGTAGAGRRRAPASSP